MGRIARSSGVESEQIVRVTRHAAERLRERVSITASLRRAALLLEAAVARAIAYDDLIDAGDGTWFAPVRLNGAMSSFAVLSIFGPKEKPYRVEVRTLITSSMAIRSHGHLVAVGRESVM